MSDEVTHSDKLPQMPADNAAIWSLRVALFSVFVLWLSIWLPHFVGPLACTLGIVSWLATWAIGVGLAVKALLNAWSATHQELAKRRAIVSLIISGMNLLLAGAFLYLVSRAVEELG